MRSVAVADCGLRRETLNSGGLIYTLVSAFSLWEVFMKVKLFFKNHWYKLLSALCVLCFCFLSVYYSCPVSASSGSGSGLIRGSKPITYTEALNSFAEKSGLSSYYIFEHFNVENYGSAFYRFHILFFPFLITLFWVK